MDKRHCIFAYLFLTAGSLWSAPAGMQPSKIQAVGVNLRNEIDLSGSVFRMASTASYSKFYLRHREVRRYLRYFRRKQGMRFIRESLERAMPYIPYIMRKLEEYDLPYELLYLPILESGYRLHAISPAKAVGPWQFIYSSALPYGLVINDWRDDRRDIVNATDAALRKIRDEIRVTGDLWLSLAAYNGGLTRIMKAKRELESLGMRADFWAMLENDMLPRETMAYVPKFIAISHIISENLNFSPNALRKNHADESLVLLRSPGKINLVDLADSIGVDQSRFFTLNAGLIRGHTPPASHKAYYIKIPVYAEEAAREYLARFSPPKRRQKSAPAPARPSYRTYVVRRGDTLAAISRRYKIHQSRIIRANPRMRPSRIYPGQRIRIPV